MQNKIRPIQRRLLQTETNVTEFYQDLMLILRPPVYVRVIESSFAKNIVASWRCKIIDNWNKQFFWGSSFFLYDVFALLRLTRCKQSAEGRSHDDSHPSTKGPSPHQQENRFGHALFTVDAPCSSSRFVLATVNIP